jgi:hypothetical protein
MRRSDLLVVLPVLLALFGTSRTAAGSTLSVFPGCFNNGNFVVVCSPSVSGGTGNYVSYAWQVTDTALLQPTYSYSFTSTDPFLRHSCVNGWVTVALTVTDSQGGTGTGTHSVGCSEWAD